MADDADGGAGVRGERCPTCGRATAARFAPFCSRRCAEIDLGRWFKGSYVIPGRPPRDDGDDPG